MVLLPTEVVPLHIFEERYKRMIGDCLDATEEFGIVWLSDDGLCDVGCTAEVTEVLERFDDGRMNILVTGTRPFRLMRRIDDMPYPAGDIEFLEESEPDGAVDADEARARYADLVERVTDERPASPELDELDAYRMAATIDLEPAAKQQLLEIRSERERLHMVGEMFRVALQRIDEAERINEVARSNGKAR